MVLVLNKQSSVLLHVASVGPIVVLPHALLCVLHSSSLSVCLQALPPSHPVAAAYAADLAARQQLAAISHEQLTAQHLRASHTHVQGSAHTATVQDKKTEEIRQHQVKAEPNKAHPETVPSMLPQPLATHGRAQQQRRLHAQHTPHLHLQHHAAAAAAAPAPAQASDAAAGSHLQVHTRLVPASGQAVHQYACGSWRFEVDEAVGEHPRQLGRR